MLPFVQMDNFLLLSCHEIFLKDLSKSSHVWRGLLKSSPTAYITYQFLVRLWGCHNLGSNDLGTKNRKIFYNSNPLQDLKFSFLLTYHYDLGPRQWPCGWLDPGFCMVTLFLFFLKYPACQSPCGQVPLIQGNKERKESAVACYWNCCNLYTMTCIVEFLAFTLR